MYLVKIRQGRVIGCLLLTFENEKSWWIQSVYVIEEERKKGHFTSLFQ
jgi:N-acetylglutamate synthase-like GNAT family acetyltransferase